jgi:carbon-monoxide dehydrogenase medium subunit
VKPAPFDYMRAASVAEAVTLLGRHGGDAKLLAGGQSLLPALNLRLAAPALLIDIGGLAALRGIALRDGTLSIGAGTRHTELLDSPLIAAHAKLLALAAAAIAHPAIRNRGTLGGSLAHADPAAELPACMLALDARIVAAGPAGERIWPASDFFTGLFTTRLAPEEVLIRVEIDAGAPGRNCAFHELARRAGDYAMIGLAATAADGTLTALRLGWFAAGPVPLRARRAEAALDGTRGDAAALAAAEEALAEDLPQHGDLNAAAATRLALARVLLRRAVADLTRQPR